MRKREELWGREWYFKRAHRVETPQNKELMTISSSWATGSVRSNNIQTWNDVTWQAKRISQTLEAEEDVYKEKTCGGKDRNGCREGKLATWYPFSTPELFTFAHDRRREELWGTLHQALSLFVVSWNKESASDWSICDAVKFERALRRSSRPLGNSMSVFYANHRSCMQS